MTLTYFITLVYFYTLKNRKHLVFWCFQGFIKRPVQWNGLAIYGQCPSLYSIYSNRLKKSFFKYWEKTICGIPSYFNYISILDWVRYKFSISLTHLFPVRPFSTHWKHQETIKVFWYSQGVKKGSIVNKKVEEK